MNITNLFACFLFLFFYVSCKILRLIFIKVADAQEEYHTLNPLFPCSDPIPVVSSVKKNVLIPVGVLAGLLLLSTIVLAVLFSIEKSKAVVKPAGRKVALPIAVGIVRFSGEQFMSNAVLYQSRFGRRWVKKREWLMCHVFF